MPNFDGFDKLLGYTKYSSVHTQVDVQEALDGLAATNLGGDAAALEEMVRSLVGPGGAVRYQEFVGMLLAGLRGRAATMMPC